MILKLRMNHNQRADTSLLRLSAFYPAYSVGGFIKYVKQWGFNYSPLLFGRHTG